MTKTGPRVKTLDYDTRCGRCGDVIEKGTDLVYVPLRGSNPLLSGSKNPRAFHIDPYCGKK